MNGWPGRVNLEYGKVKGWEMEGVEGQRVTVSMSRLRCQKVYVLGFL